MKRYTAKEEQDLIRINKDFEEVNSVGRAWIAHKYGICRDRDIDNLAQKLRTLANPPKRKPCEPKGNEKDYEALLANYSAMSEKYHALAEEYASFVEKHCELEKKYEELVAAVIDQASLWPGKKADGLHFDCAKIRDVILRIEPRRFWDKVRSLGGLC